MANKKATDAHSDEGATSAREATIAAVLTHAAELFAERGPAATSIRDIGTRSGVNHGLLFRYLGTKDQLVKAVLNHLADDVAAAARAGAPVTVIAAKTELQLRVVARATLDGFAVGRLQDRFPIAANLISQALSSHEDERTGRMSAANVIALQLAWQLFEPLLRAATGTEDIPSDELQERLNTEIGRMLRADPQELYQIAFPVN
ncbi:TetR/AcrR family transcriptional regulator [Mycolicibacter arupensis]|uniref:TetR/AcrR family transcriptional regulator n=1 Tax=Mycolicibacter arupensis TaxID=342002 RepID=UPI001F3F0B06|nr:helix-turn-helix domain-containing protein [Mycolicibacter arupensis]